MTGKLGSMEVRINSFVEILISNILDQYVLRTLICLKVTWGASGSILVRTRCLPTTVPATQSTVHLKLFCK